MFPRCIVGFLQVEKHCDNMLSQYESFAYEAFKPHQLICSASVFVEATLDMRDKLVFFQVPHQSGCEVWCINPSETYKLSVIWNNVYRKIFNCCWRESVRPLLYFCHMMPLTYYTSEIYTLSAQTTGQFKCFAAAFG